MRNNYPRLGRSFFGSTLFLVLCSALLVGGNNENGRTAQTIQPSTPVIPKEPQSASVALSQECASHQRFFSAALNREMSYCLILPVDYYQGTDTHPVLYLLHGLWGNENDWTAQTHIVEYAKSVRLIIVMPQGDDSWYVNSATEVRNKYEDYLFKDLRTEVETKYRAKKSREGRLMAGLSMGGYGSLRLGIIHPDSFIALGTFSGGLAVTANPNVDDRVTPALAFGGPTSPSWKKEDVFVLLEKASIPTLPYIFASCGTSDQLLAHSLHLRNVLNGKTTGYEYHEIPGGHTWHVWDETIQIFLHAMVEQHFVEREVVR